jgi:hypothetical protein
MKLRLEKHRAAGVGKELKKSKHVETEKANNHSTKQQILQFL